MFGKSTFLLAGLLSGLCVSAAPFAEWLDVSVRTGGTVRLWGEGDEYSASFETESGYAVRFDPSRLAYFYLVQEADGSLVFSDLELGAPGAAEAIVARVKPHLRDTSEKARAARLERIRRFDGDTGRDTLWTSIKRTTRARREAKKKGLLMAPPSTPTLGTVRGLTILVDFPVAGSDKTLWETSHPTVTPEKLSSLLNGDYCELYGNVSSVRQYYHEASNGCLDYWNEVIGPICAPHPREYYDDKTKDNGECATNLIAHILGKIRDDPDFETKYLPKLQTLSVQDGRVRSLNIWFAGPSATEWGQGLWAHKWALYDSRVSGVLTFPAGGTTARFYNYQVTPVTSSPLIYTFCHENGHMLCGFPDLYVYEGQGNGVGYFSLMYGSELKTNPPFFDAYLRAAAGWLEPQILPPAGGTVTVRNNHTDVWKYENPANADEYYLIENRQRTGRDESLAASGVLIWRCDESGSNQYPSPTTDLTGFATGVHRKAYELSLEQADGKYHLEQKSNTGDANDAWFSGNSASGGVFGDSTLPTAKWKNASASGLKLSAFSANGETMTFKVDAYSDSPAAIPLSEALDNDELVFSTGGNADWFGQTAQSSDGVSAARSGAIGNSKSTWLRTSVTGPGTISFMWKASSESGYDYLRFAIDDEEQSKTSGPDNSWTAKSYEIAEGVHSLCWTYGKDHMTVKGDDAGYVDRVVWTPAAKVAEPVIAGPSGATFVPPAEISISCATAGSTIRYTLDGSDPTEESAVYAGPITITTFTEIRARAFKPGLHPSAVVVAAFQNLRTPGEVLGTEGIEWINDPTIPWREEEPANMRTGGLGKQYTSTLQAKVKGKGKLTFSYKACIYSGNNKFTFKQGSTQKFSKSYSSSAGTDFAEKKTYTVTKDTETTFTWTYDVSSTSAASEYFDYAKCGVWLYDVVWDPDNKAATPVIGGPAASIFDGPREISVSCSTAGAVLHYTLDGSDPTEQSPVVQNGKIVLAAAATLKVRAFKDGIGGSAVAEARYLEKVEPGEWTDDADRAQLSAAIDGKLILFLRADCANSQWTGFENAVNTRNFRKWTKENKVYLVLRDDSDRTCPANLTTWWTTLGGLGTTTTDGALIPQFYLIAPASCNTALASAYAMNGHAVGSMTFDRSSSSLISGIRSLLEGEDVELTSCPTDDAAVAFQVAGVTWINASDVPWTEVGSDGQMRTGGLKSKTYDSTLTAKVVGPGTFRFSYRVCSYSDSNPVSYSVNGVQKKSIGKTGVSYATDDVTIDVGDGLNEISWTYSVSAADSDYSSGYAADNKSAWCGIWLYGVSWNPMVAKPVIGGPETAVVVGSLDVAVSCATEGAVVRYTTDGTDPTESSPAVQGGKVTITGGGDVTLKVRAFKDGLSPSAVASARYLRKAEPGEWTSDVERVKLSAADNRLACVLLVGKSQSTLKTVIFDGEFLDWAAANEVYLLLWDYEVDNQSTPVASFFKTLSSSAGEASLTYTHMLFAKAPDWTTAVGKGVATSGYKIGEETYKGTVSTLIAGFKSILAANGLLDPFPPVTPVGGQTEAEAVAAELAATFGAESEVVKRITTQERLAEFNAFVKSCGILSAADFPKSQLPYAYSSFVLSSILENPMLLEVEPKLEITSSDPANDGVFGGWDFTVSLDTGSDDLPKMVAEKLGAMIRVGTDVNDITHDPQVIRSSAEKGNPLTLTIAKPGEKSGFIRVRVDR